MALIEDLFATPAPKPVRLEEFSIHELEERIATLEAEAAQCRALIASKRASLSAADAVFGTKQS